MFISRIEKLKLKWTLVVSNLIIKCLTISLFLFFDKYDRISMHDIHFMMIAFNIYLIVFKHIIGLQDYKLVYI